MNKSAVLELNSDNQGFLLPRIADTALINPLLPPDGMMIYSIPLKQVLIRSNGYWQLMPISASIPMNWYATGNSGTDPSVHFLGTLDDKPMIIKSNNQIFWEFGRRQTLGLTQNYPDYTDPNERVTHLRSALQFEAAGAQFYKPKMFVDANGNFRMKGSSAGTDYFEFGATGTNNNGGFEFVIGDDGDEPLVFKSYNFQPGVFTEIMRLQNGRMGLGTTTPSEKLDVLGNIRFSGALMPNNTAGTTGQVLQSNGANVAPTWINVSMITASNWAYGGNGVASMQNFGTTSNFAIPFVVNNVERMRLTTTGNLAIGNTSGTEKLDVTGNVKFSGALMPNNTAGTGGQLLQSNGVNAAPTWISPSSIIASTWAYNGNTLTAETKFGTISNHALPFITANAERMRLTTTGNLAIGNALGTERLDVTGNVKFSGALMPNNTAGTGGQLLQSNGAGSAPTWISPTYWTYGGNGVTAMQNLGTTTAYDLPIITSNAERMRILASNGNVGIANIAPTEKLDVTGNVKFSGALMPNNSAGTSGYVLRSNGVNAAPTWTDPAALIGNTVWLTTGNTVAALPRLGTNNAFDLPFYTNGTEGMRLTTTNRLGIAMTNPAEQLDVNGNIKISGGQRRLVFGNVGGDPDAVIELRRYLETESSELLFYSGNDHDNAFGPDRIRMVTEEFRVQGFGSDIGNLSAAETGNTLNNRFLVNVKGNVAIGTDQFNTSSPEKLLIDAGTTSSYNLVNARGSINNYLQFNIQNTNAGNVASSDIVATANNGNESRHYIDMGINSSGFTDATYPIISGANNAYLYSTGNDLIIGNATLGRSVKIFSGGTATTNERIRIESDGDVGIGTSTPDAKLDVQGTFKLGSIGTVLTNMIKGTIDLPYLSEFGYTVTRVVTINIPNLTANATVMLNPRANLPTGIAIGWSRASTGQLTIGFTNADTTPRAVSAMTYDITIIQ